MKGQGGHLRPVQIDMGIDDYGFMLNWQSKRTSHPLEKIRLLTTFDRTQKTSFPPFDRPLKRFF
jgi:hypothetical protein